MTTWPRRILFLILILVLIQLVRPHTSNPSVDPARTLAASMSVDPQVASLLARSCHDCHSNSTVWPWYSKVAPASWLVASDVNRGRKAMNFSEWATLDRSKQKSLLMHICDEVKDGEMPMHQYVILHPGAHISRSEVKSICAWTNSGLELQHQAQGTPSAVQ